MISTAIIIFREIIEIAMVLSIVFAATSGLRGRTVWILSGVSAGLLGAALVAIFTRTISASLSGLGQEFFNAIILFTAAIVIGWTVIWMRQHGRELAERFKHVGQEVAAGKLPMYSLALICGLTIVREGSEIVLFIYGMALSGQGPNSIFIGTVLGFGLGAGTGFLLYYGLLKIPMRYMLTVTSWLLVLLVAGLASQGAVYLSAAGYFSNLSSQVWDTSWLLSENTIFGKAMHALVGYSARPTEIQLVFYLGTLGLFAFLMATIERRNKIIIAALVIFTFSITAIPQPAYALDEIYSPIVEPHELEFEYNGSRTFDQANDKDNNQNHEFIIEYGLNGSLELEASVGLSNKPNDALRLHEIQGELRWQFFEQGYAWLDSGILIAYGQSIRANEPGAFEAKLLLQKDIGRFTNRLNVGFEQQVGSNAESGPAYVFLWNTRYRYNYYFEPGFEIQSDLGHGRDLGRFEAQEHYIGPALYGHIAPNLKFEAAYLWGVTKASSRAASRILLEYEMPIY
jgi:FTR1 family protein